MPYGHNCLLRDFWGHVSPFLEDDSEKSMKQHCGIIKIEDKNMLVDVEDLLDMNEYNWRINKGGYAITNIKNYTTNKWVTMLAHRIICPNYYIVDHINCNRLDNRRQNLREVTYSQNKMNSRKINNSSYSIYKGVSYSKKRNKFSSEITINKKRIFLGYFDKELDAANAYVKAAKIYQKEYINEKSTKDVRDEISKLYVVKTEENIKFNTGDKFILVNNELVRVGE